jgi:signal transduction histidine kinase
MRILAVVVVLGVAPVLVIGFRLASDAERVGEEVLRGRLEDGLLADIQSMEQRWVPLRSSILDLTDLPEVREALARTADDDPSPTLQDTEALGSAFETLPPGLGRVVLRNSEGVTVWDTGVDAGTGPGLSPFGDLLSIPVPLYDRVTGEPTGTLTADMALVILRPQASATALAGAIVTAFSPGSGSLLLPSPFPLELLGGDAFSWEGETWVVERRSGSEPVLTLVAAAPLAPFTVPFREASRRGALVLIGMAILGIGLAFLVTSRLTASLERVSSGAWAVAEGELDRSVPVEGAHEVQQLAKAFNRMTESLRTTLRQLADRESLAAVNEFAAALAHEVRNPLTSLQLDLQGVEEELPEDFPLRGVQTQAIEDLRRLDRIVGGALETARSGQIELGPTELVPILESVAHRAQPHADAGGVDLEIDVDTACGDSTRIQADAAALQRVILNLVLNGIQASPPGAVVRIEATRRDRKIVVTVRDQGEGIPPDRLERILEPFFTTRPGGTGVGLSIARRIVAAHRGTLDIESEVGKGTAVSVVLPQGFPS